MKFREGFVSNSSTASFIIPKSGVSEEGMKFLRKNFKNYTLDDRHLIYPTDKDKRVYLGTGKRYFVMKKKSLEEQIFGEKDEKEYGHHANEIRIDVTCNEDEVICDLFAHKIPFIATIHYEHFLLFFDGKKIKMIPTNLEMFMYFGCDLAEESFESTSFDAINKRLEMCAKGARFRERELKKMLKECNK